MTYYSLSRARMRRLKRRKRRPALRPYEAQQVSRRARNADHPTTPTITRYHPRDWGHFGAEIRDGDDAA